jgi:hypothetical protein
MKKEVKQPWDSEFDRGLIVGVTLACSIVDGIYDCPREVSAALAACGIDRRLARKAGAEKCDLDQLKAAFAELSPPKRGRGKK